MKKVTFALLLIAVFSNVAKAEKSYNAAAYCMGVMTGVNSAAKKTFDKTGNQTAFKMMELSESLGTKFTVQMYNEINRHLVTSGEAAEAILVGTGYMVTSEGLLSVDPKAEAQYDGCLDMAKKIGWVK